MIFQDKNPEFPWKFWTLQYGKTQVNMLHMVSLHFLGPLLDVFFFFFFKENR